MNESNKISKHSVIVMDPADIRRAGCRAMLRELPLVGDIVTASNNSELLMLLANANFHIVLININSINNHKDQTIELIKSFCSRVKLICISTYYHRLTIRKMIDRGANAFVLDNISLSNLNYVLESVLASHTIVCNENAEYVITRTSKYEISHAAFPFTQRTREILFLIANQLCSKEIAHHLRISEKTVEKYRKDLFRALEVKNVVGLAQYAFMNNIHTDRELIDKFQLK